jgi:hypothetical protein
MSPRRSAWGRPPYRDQAFHPARRGHPLQVALAVILVASLCVLAMSGITRYAVGEPVIPPALARLLDRPEPSLPPGMTYNFAVIDPLTKRALSVLPEVGTIELRLAVTNDSALPITMHFPTGQQCEFIVRRIFYYVDGLFAIPLEVWRSTYFHTISPRPSVLILQPGQTKVYTATFTLNALNALQLPPGRYRLIANFDSWQTSLPMDKPL